MGRETRRKRKRHLFVVFAMMNNVRGFASFLRRHQFSFFVVVKI